MWPSSWAEMALEECRDKRLRKVGSKMHGKANNISASKRHIKSLISFLFPSNGRSAALYPDGKQTLRVLPSSTVAVHLFDFEGEDYDAGSLYLLRQKKLISIVRSAPTEKITKIADALWRGGLRFMEITFDQTGNIPQEVSAEQIRMVRESFGDRLHVGAGTVMTETQRKLATAAGAEYIISSNVNVEIIRATKAAGLLSIPGAFTPFEIITAYEAGTDFVKFFPADCVDPHYIKAIRTPINHIPLLAVGGVTPENLGEYLHAGMAGAGIGGAMVRKENVAANDFDAVAARAACYVAVVERL